MASPSELSLDFKPHSYSMLLKSFGDQNDQTYKLEEFLSRLEEERLKIDAFKRELPLCMQLLTNAMEASRQQLETFRINNQDTRPVLEEFIPVNHLASDQSSDHKATNMSDKANWMTSAQLWSQASEAITKQQSTIMKDSDDMIGFNNTSPKLVLDNKQRNGGAFLPFSKERNSVQALPELALSSAEKEIEDKKHAELEKGGSSCQKRESNSGNNDGVVIDQAKENSVASHAQNTNNNNNNTTNQNQNHRKARRCWSPDLHRRFVNALQMLGGSQVATPKQIRELMKVDGLTNDEVKSHLQKYRLHTRRPSPSPQSGAPAAQLVVLGGIWVPPEYATTAAHTGGTPTLYGAHPTSHAPPPHYCAQEFYTTAPPQPLLPPPPRHHHHMHMYRTTAHGHRSPESARDPSESIEDGKSESSSWKGESEGDRKESNESEITLKF